MVWSRDRTFEVDRRNLPPQDPRMGIFASTQKYFRAKKNRRSLDYLLGQSPSPNADLRDRLDWFIDLIQWVRVEGSVGHVQMDFSSGAPQAQRVHWILHLLGKNPDWRRRFQQTMTSVFRDCQAAELFVSTGISNRAGLWSKALDRFQTLFLPNYSDDMDLTSLVSQTFTQPEDVLWIQQIDSKVFDHLLEICNDPDLRQKMRQDLITSLRVVGSQIAGLGLEKTLRDRTPWISLSKNSFFLIPAAIEKFSNLCT